MVPRAEVVAVDEDTPIEEIKALFISTGFSKIPVFQKTIDQILGYVHVFDMMKNPKILKNILLPSCLCPRNYADQ
jgi:CBS domain containing-hemolysin-like protein